MNLLTCADFEGFFRELYGSHRSPYDWQMRLAERAVMGHWPSIIDLPTGSGKTACIDIAIFALACQSALEKSQRTAPRRIFFCVNRRVIVDEAHQRALHIAKSLAKAEKEELNAPTLRRVAAALRHISTLRRESAPPLDVLELRGGIYRDNRWARSITQPTIICTTIDQLGSRLLFRGYGVSPNAAPIHAALLAYDSIVLLDEAHISRPFQQTLYAVKNYLDPVRWCKHQCGAKRMIVVPMTATPPERKGNVEAVRLEPKDRENASLDNRLKAKKPANLVNVPGVAQAAVEYASELVLNKKIAIGIIVNRVATAKAIYTKLNEKYLDLKVELVIGSMRPLDRDEQSDRLHSVVGPGRPPITKDSSIVVATQCLEVGADYDFDALITECASIDALRQRFGRLNRGGRDIHAQAVVLMDNAAVKPRKPDPIYGDALPATWLWLNERGVVAAAPDNESSSNKKGNKKTATTPTRSIDFGIDEFKPHWDALDSEEKRRPLLAPSASLDAPVMLPAYLDLWCQTNPRPALNPEVSLFIHGPQGGEPDVQVCWRADLVDNNYLKWCDIIGLLSPTSAECMSVPISRVRRWLTEATEDSNQSDVLGRPEQTDAIEESKRSRDRRGKSLIETRRGVLWRSKPTLALDDLRPGDTLVLPATTGGWDILGHVPNASTESIDIAEKAFRQVRVRTILRLHPVLRQSRWPDSVTVTDLFTRIADADTTPTHREFCEILKQFDKEFRPDHPHLADICRELADRRSGLISERYPDDLGVVLTSRRPLATSRAWYLRSGDEGEDNQSWTSREEAVSLQTHTLHVKNEVLRTIRSLPCDELHDIFCLAAEWHDLGKADERFQAMLRRTDRTDAWLLTSMPTALLAKSDGLPLTSSERMKARLRADLPEGFRHEMLSVQIVEKAGLHAADEGHQALTLHLIAAHHGHARPFAPVVLDSNPPDVDVAGAMIFGQDREQVPSHRIDSGIADRFWKLTRHYGWWGLAYLEAILRLADQQASADEDAGVIGNGPTEIPTECEEQTT